jgi:hypothetical protein
MKVPTTGGAMKPSLTMSCKSRSIVKTLWRLKTSSSSRNKSKPKRKQQGRLKRREDNKKSSREGKRVKRQLPLERREQQLRQRWVQNEMIEHKLLLDL